MTITFTNVMWAYLMGMPMDLRMGHRGLPGEKSIYGNVEPGDWDEDYYVGVSVRFGDGSVPMGSRDIDYGHFYPSRVFLWGEHDDGRDVSREDLLAFLKRTGVHYGDRAFWNPCRPWSGYLDGRPTFHNALRADANVGMRMYALERALQAATNKDLDVYIEHPGFKVTIYVDESETDL